MRGQMTLGTQPRLSEAAVFELIQSGLCNVIEEDYVPLDHLTAVRKRGFTSVMYASSLLCRLCFRGEKSYVEINGRTLERIPVDDEAQLTALMPRLAEALDRIIDRLPTDFDCCSRYEACSDAKRCIHPDREMALGCRYRRNLKAGKIFYGKNRNI